MKKTYVGIVRDHSGSMYSIRNAAAQDYNALIATIKQEAQTQDTIVSVVECGAYPSGVGRVWNRAALSEFARVIELSSANALQPISYYAADGGSTPLLDSVGDLITQFSNTPDINDPNVNVLILVVTDGHENASITWNTKRLAEHMQKLQQTDRWTFAFRVPRNHKSHLVRNLLIPEDNILEWETTSKGMQEATVVTTRGISKFYEDTKNGKTASTKFYTDLSNVTTEDVKASCVDISAHVQVWLTTQKEVIRPFCEKQTGQPFVKGAAFYQLTKPEREVQDYKKIMIRDKKTGSVYAGAAARQMLGLPTSGTISLVPGNHGQFDLYIQSTSINRVLPPGTQLMYWPDHDKPVIPARLPKVTPKTTVAKTTKLQTAPTAKSASAHSSAFIKGYIDGFAAGKKQRGKPLTMPSVVGTTDYALGYGQGFKDGRGKKKQLHK